jgi:hypothetical protein
LRVAAKKNQGFLADHVVSVLSESLYRRNHEPLRTIDSLAFLLAANLYQRNHEPQETLGSVASLLAASTYQRNHGFRRLRVAAKKNQGFLTDHD